MIFDTFEIWTFEIAESQISLLWRLFEIVKRFEWMMNLSINSIFKIFKSLWLR